MNYLPGMSAESSIGSLQGLLRSPKPVSSQEESAAQSDSNCWGIHLPCKMAVLRNGRNKLLQS